MRAFKKELYIFLNPSGTQYVIPVYQRNYSWEIAHCEKLFKDILNLMDKPTKEYFVGSIVYIANQDNSTDVRQFYIIDGQQRLTTVTLILTALYHLLKNKELESVRYSTEQIHDEYLVNKYSQDKASRLRLKPIETDAHHLEEILTEGRIQNKKSAISLNYQWFKKHLKLQLKSSERVDAFIDAFKRLVIVEMELQEGNDPQLIFESLNNAGKKLDESDLIRNCVLMNQSPSEQTALYKRYWHPIEKNTYNQEAKIEDANETTEFIRHFLIAKLGKFVKVDDVYITFKDLVTDTPHIESFLDELKRFSEYYASLMAEKSPENSLNTHIENINKLKQKVCYPLVLIIFEAYFHHKCIDLKTTIECLQQLESFIFRRIVLDLTNAQMNKVFATFVSKVKSSLNTFNFQQTLTSHLASLQNRQRFPSDKEFIYQLQTRDFGNNTSLIKYLLEKLETFKKAERVETDDLTIEHIMPKKLNEKWKEDLGSDYEQVHSTYLNTLGNLTLTGYNGSYSNKPFREKRDMPHGFRESMVWLNRSVAECDTWNESSIQERAYDLSMYACKVWKPLPQALQALVRDEERMFFNLGDEPETVTNSKPCELVLFNQKYAVSSWKKLYQKVLEVLMLRDDLKLFQVASEQLFEHADACRDALQLNNGQYIESNRSAKSIFELCQNVVSAFTDNDEDFIVYVS
jgi:uncharacterized protein with ParB-like and HNH nuclease domain